MPWSNCHPWTCCRGPSYHCLKEEENSSESYRCLWILRAFYGCGCGWILKGCLQVWIGICLDLWMIWPGAQAIDHQNIATASNFALRKGSQSTGPSGNLGFVGFGRKKWINLRDLSGFSAKIRDFLPHSPTKLTGNEEIKGSVHIPHTLRQSLSTLRLSKAHFLEAWEATGKLWGDPLIEPEVGTASVHLFQSLQDKSLFSMYLDMHVKKYLPLKLIYRLFMIQEAVCIVHLQTCYFFQCIRHCAIRMCILQLKTCLTKRKLQSFQKTLHLWTAKIDWNKIALCKRLYAFSKNKCCIIL